MKNKIVSIWSKHENRVLIYSIVIFLLLCVYSNLSVSLIDFEPHNIGEYDPDSVVAGYALLFDASGFLLSILGIALYFMVIIFFFSGCGLVSLILNIISRLFRIGVYKKWKDITAKVLFFIGLIPSVLVLIGIFFFSTIYIELNIMLFLISLITFILIIVINIFAIKSLFKIKQN